MCTCKPSSLKPCLLSQAQASSPFQRRSKGGSLAFKVWPGIKQVKGNLADWLHSFAAGISSQYGL